MLANLHAAHRAQRGLAVADSEVGTGHRSITKIIELHDIPRFV
jgi:hypothetical protein